MLKRLKQLALQGLITELDYYFAAYVAEKSSPADPNLLLACALLSNQTGQGHVCIELEQFAEKPLFGSEMSPDVKTLYAPKRAEWRSVLQSCQQVSGPGNQAMMILDGSDRLYLSKYWHFEEHLADHLLSRATETTSIDLERLRSGLQRLFPSFNDEIDWQKLAAAIAVIKPFSVISGGPGTGKTTTVTKLLALLIEQSMDHPVRIALVAPTGKAAARLSESIKEKKQQIECSDEVRNLIPDEASTIHRLLGVRAGRNGFHHNRDNPLHIDVLVVDEASMIDLPLMARLMEALPQHARVILLGDKDQLASVEAGSVLGDICDAGLNKSYSAELCDLLEQVAESKLTPLNKIDSPLTDSIALLRKSYRFDETSGIGALASAVNNGDVERAINCLNDMLYSDVAWQSVSASQLAPSLCNHIQHHYQNYLACTDAAEALELFNQFRILTAVREGPFGVSNINRVVESQLIRQHLIPADQRWYKGRPIMISRNDHGMKLYNGDIGMIWPDSESGNRLRAFFVMADGSVRKVLPNRLPEHETVFAMTVHKSQGSEFDQVLTVLPDEGGAMVSRELIYTAITRAKSYVEIWGSITTLQQGIARKLVRSSGLVSNLQGHLKGS